MVNFLQGRRIGSQGWGQFNSGNGIAAQFQFQFRNWNWNWNWWNWKWNWNWKPWNWNWNWNWKPELNFLQLLPQQSLTEEVIIFHVTDSSCNRCSWDIALSLIESDRWLPNYWSSILGIPSQFLKLKFSVSHLENLMNYLIHYRLTCPGANFTGKA